MIKLPIFARVQEDEKHELFEASIPSNLSRDTLLQDKKVSWKELRASIGSPLPDDIPREEGGTLSLLKLEGVGPAKELHFEPAERVNLITGDNGLGKTFLLDCAWWALSGTWASSRAYPYDSKIQEPKITFQIVGESGTPEEVSSSYNWESQDWSLPEGRPPIPGLLIYARIDGAFAVWDPARDYWKSSSRIGIANLGPLVFTRDDVWNGLRIDVGGETRFLSNGLIEDWVDWQRSSEVYPFETLRKVLMRLSPPGLDRGDLGPLEPGDPVRIPGDSRSIPTIRHSYGQVPLVYTSAGVRRIVALAYLIVWAWEEHKAQSHLIRREPQRRMVVLVDEMEAHLHPQWQRSILPALLDVKEDLEAELEVQLLVTTHSPLVTASMEPRFDANRDKIFHLDVFRSDLFGGEVVLEEPDFIPYGPVDAWLRSDIFEMRHPRSLEAEQAIEDAKRLQLKDEVTTEEVQEVSERLVKYLAADDRFWPRWTFFATKHGVQL
ncbi:MAG: AAA family ATPase [Anaerolineales bacterium]|nr:AAA family ATPase [Anaerolineales bacterium]